ncbi:MAG: hypothetical protein R3D57_03305 [Hyphomicrobiaceae bacterium]
MKKTTRIALVTGLLGLAGAAGVVAATADQGGGWGGHGMRGHHGWGMDEMGGGKRWHRGGGRMMHMLGQLDTNKDKKLTQEEIDGARSALLTTHDANKDGALTLDEFEGVFMEQMRQMMVRQFQRLDRDGNASITAEEFSEPFAGLVARMDRNNDGVLDENDRGRGKGKWRHRDGNRGGMMGDAPGTEAPADTEAPAEDGASQN